MPIEKYEVQPLFAEPFFRTSIGSAITPEQEEFIKNLEMEQNKANLISKNKYIFEEPELKSIKDAVKEVLDFYATEIMGITQELYVTQSWSLINKPSVGMHGHSHSNSLISGSLYYTEMPDPPSRMVFDRHNSYQLLQFVPDADKQNIYNTPLNIVTPTKHELFLFNSGIQHVVENNQAEGPRYAIAFNTFVRGKMGDYVDVSELTL